MSTLVFYWDISSTTLSYLVFNSQNMHVFTLPTQLNIPTPNQAGPLVAGIYAASALHGVTDVEYKILQHGTQGPNIYGRGQQATPHALSQAVLDAVENHGNALGLNFASQVRNKLSGDSLKIFKSALRALTLTNGAGAWEHHLWSVGFHATNARVERIIKRLWSTLTGTSALTRVGKTQYQAWRANL